MIPLGVALQPRGAGGNAIDALVAQARQAAEAGLESVWLGQMYDLDALTAAAVIGREVPDIGLGTAVTVTHTRHPITMSSQAQTVQAAVGGRLTLGIGVSHRRPIEQRFGLDFAHPARHMREYLEALQPLLREGAVNVHGSMITADTSGFSGHVAGSTPPPVLVAALGPAMLRVAGELADGTVTFLAGPRALGTHIVPKLTAAAAGRAAQVVASLPVCVTGDREDAHERAAAELGFYAAVPSYRMLLDLEQLSSPTQAAVIGDESEVEDRIRQLAEVGVTRFVANVPGFATARERERTLGLLAAMAGA
ncbi:TIGR03564 family F420-dependent LLM class oxidoreductase [Actinospica durhamensis]|uniref:TIGR03564 family F420-dependent LLM class oxidoreductase n=1 Tax=Actinospica durhamensis TaxID=1508375 RepID=A0A941IPJ9_9ACTN|nr:TIGR03564 family F420-dependent LLM class oxidoreductase [Actinospica durhamensis]MBR7835214.1 TIGR03564 family F420-dependent LLM class oxidoreductase [Actinospica durhamensis]